MSEKEISIIDTEFGFYNELPEIADPIIKMEIKGDKLWVKTESGKKYIAPHHSEGKPVRADLRLIKNE